MSHELSVTNGIASMAYLEGEAPPWWTNADMQGVIMQPGASLEEWMRASSLDALVEGVPVHQQAPDNGMVEVPGYQLIRRMRDGHPYGIMSNEYKIAQTVEAFSRFKRIIGEQVPFSTMGALDTGARFWGSAKLADFIAAGDRHKGYLLMTCGHDGKHAWEAGGTTVRVVCANTLRAAVGSGGGKSKLRGGHKVAHRGDMEAKMDAASDEVARALGFFTTYQAAAEAMATTQIPAKEAAEFAINLVCDVLPKVALIATDGGFRLPSLVDLELSTYRQNRIDEILVLAKHGKGQEKHQGSAWALFNGITEHIDHGDYRGGSTSEGRFLRSLEGTNAAMKDTAYRYLSLRSGVAA